MDWKLCGDKPTSPSLPKAHPNVNWPFEELLVRQPCLLIVPMWQVKFSFVSLSVKNNYIWGMSQASLRLSFANHSVRDAFPMPKF